MIRSCTREIVNRAHFPTSRVNDCRDGRRLPAFSLTAGIEAGFGKVKVARFRQRSSYLMSYWTIDASSLSSRDRLAVHYRCFGMMRTRHQFVYRRQDGCSPSCGNFYVADDISLQAGY